MTREKTNPDFVEALARGLDIIKAFGTYRSAMSLTDLAARANLARATARRFLLTLEQLGYVKTTPAGFVLTPRVLELGVAYTMSARVWEAARVHLDELVQATQQASSIAELDGSDIIYVARVEIPKVVGVNIDVGTRYPARSTALGKVLLASLDADELAATLAQPSLAQTQSYRALTDAELMQELREIRSRGWTATSSEMTGGVRSIAAPIRQGGGNAFAAVNLSVLATEVSQDQLINDFLPRLLVAAGEIGRDFTLLRDAPQTVLAKPAPALRSN